MIGLLWSLHYIQYFFDVVRNTPNNKYLLEIIKRSSKERKCMSCGRVLNFDQRKTFSSNYKLITVWLWLFYKFIKNNYRLRFFSEFIQTQKSYPTCLDKTSIATWKLYVISSQIFFVNQTPRELTPCKISHICLCGFEVRPFFSTVTRLCISHFLSLDQFSQKLSFWVYQVLMSLC